MVVTVKFFAELRERKGQSELKIKISEALTVAQIWTKVCADMAFPERVLIAVNMEYATQNTLVHDGDEVAFFPPVTGG
jgi:molybdopterin synthase sulfur carrier subunit